jgi:LysM repeat protein
VADDRTTPPPAPRPRRRRTDIDPKAPTPSVANERRRRGAAAESKVATDDPATSAAWAAVAARLVEHATPTDAGATGEDATAPFHVPGAVAAAVAMSPSMPDRPIVEVDPGRAWLARLDDRSLDPNTCPFLRAASDGALGTPIERPDPANRCAALSEAVPQSLRQQELVCLSSGHVNCPRYLRGASIAVEAPTPVVRTGRTLTTPVFASLVLLVMAVSASVAFAFARGGIGLSAAVPSPSATAVAALPSVSPIPVVATPSPTASPTASASIAPSLSPSATPAPATATPKPTPAPTQRSDRYKLLRACPGTPKCWIYRVRSGDNLYSIAHYFGVSVNSIYARNPWLKSTGLRAGQELRLPPPTR